MAKKPKNMKAALKQVEKSAKDKKRDKTKGYAEGSPSDEKADKAQAKKIMKRKGK